MNDKKPSISCKRDERFDFRAATLIALVRCMTIPTRDNGLDPSEPTNQQFALLFFGQPLGDVLRLYVVTGFASSPAF